MARPAKIKAASVGNGTALYLGQHVRQVDHGRVILPVEWRPDASPRDFTVISWPVLAPEYLLVLPPSRWEVLQRDLEARSTADEETAEIERSISSRICLSSLDRYGRLPLPEEVLKGLGIEKEATLVGRINKFEVWNTSRFTATLANTKPQLIATALKSIRI